jgi:16S rRNA (guanine527-N7)-methyltransferase
VLAALAAESKPPTTVSEPRAAADVHIADSLAGLEVEELAHAARIVDIGAGAGFPGLVLAVALARSSVDLLEANGRKTAFINRLARATGIENAQARPARAEEWPSAPGFSPYQAATARAVAPLAVLVEYAAPLLTEGGVLVAWKGRVSEAERAAGRCAAAQVGLAETEIRPVQPYSGSLQRTLYVYSKVSETPSRFPRRAGMAARRPLA